MRSHRKLIVLAATCVALQLTCPSVVLAQDGRAETWEAGFNIADVKSETLTGNRNVQLDIGSELSYGFTASYHVTDRFAVGGDLWFSSPNYQATRVLDDALATSQTVSASLDIWTIQVKGTFNFLEGPLSPYIEGGAGWTEVDSNLPSGPPTTGCWWDPWWGYVCSSFYQTYTETRASVMYGIGLRWELGSGMVLRGSYNVQSIETNHASEDADFGMYRLDLLWRF